MTTGPARERPPVDPEPAARRVGVAARVLAGAAGLAAPIVLCWGVLTSLSGLPRFSLRHGFISELAVPWNPHAGRLNSCFLVGGALVIGFAAFAMWRAWSRRGRVAGLLTAAAGLGLVGVGVYPLTTPWPHLAAALFAGGCSLAAGLVGAGAARRAAQAAPDDRMLGGAAIAARLLALTAAAAAIGCVGYFFWVSAGVGADSIDTLFRALPQALRIELGGKIYNPLAVLEWLFFGVLAVELAGFAVVDLVGLNMRRRRPATSSS